MSEPNDKTKLAWAELELRNQRTHIAELEAKLAAADKTAATVQPQAASEDSYNVDGVVMTPLKYIDYLHDRWNVAAQSENSRNAARYRRIREESCAELGLTPDRFDAEIDNVLAQARKEQGNG